MRKPGSLQPSTLTDYEQLGSFSVMNLSDGHASQDFSSEFAEHVENLNGLWQRSNSITYTDMAKSYVNTFSLLAGTPCVNATDNFVICPTASNSIDIVGAVLNERRAVTCLVEPTFDNLALILRRRGVMLVSVSDGEVADIETEDDCREVFDNRASAIFLVSPNNPTGTILSQRRLGAVIEHCCRRDKILILDNSFRFHKRVHYDDYKMLFESGVSFLSLEDTGKVWPTQEVKASLLVCSDDLREPLAKIYNEIYLCASKFSLMLLERLIHQSRVSGLKTTLWDVIDARRDQVRAAVAASIFEFDPPAATSELGVAWLSVVNFGLNDLDTTDHLRELGVSILPGRQFFWRNGDKRRYHSNVRISLLRPKAPFDAAMAVIASVKQPGVPRTSYLEAGPGATTRRWA